MNPDRPHNPYNETLKNMTPEQILAARGLTKEEIFYIDGVYRQAKRNLEEIPLLIEYLEVLFPHPGPDFEERLKIFDKTRKGVNGT